MLKLIEAIIENALSSTFLAENDKESIILKSEYTASIINELQNNESLPSDILLRALESLKIASRSREGSDALFSAKGMKNLLRLAFKNKEFDPESPASLEALKCLTNCMLNELSLVPIAIESETHEIVISALKVIQLSNHDQEFKGWRCLSIPSSTIHVSFNSSKYRVCVYLRQRLWLKSTPP